MIPLRGWVVPFGVAMLLILTSINSKADEAITPRHQRPGRITCAVVKEFIAMVGEIEAEKMARASGAGDAQIAAAKRCLK